MYCDPQREQISPPYPESLGRLFFVLISLPHPRSVPCFSLPRAPSLRPARPGGPDPFACHVDGDFVLLPCPPRPQSPFILFAVRAPALLFHVSRVWLPLARVVVSFSFFLQGGLSPYFGRRLGDSDPLDRSSSFPRLPFTARFLSPSSQIMRTSVFYIPDALSTSVPPEASGLGRFLLISSRPAVFLFGCADVLYPPVLTCSPCLQCSFRFLQGSNTLLLGSLGFRSWLRSPRGRSESPIGAFAG